MKIKISTFLLFITANILNAQTVKPDFTSSYYDAVAGALLIIIILVGVAFLFWGTEEKEPQVKVVKESVIKKYFAKLNGLLTGAVPIEKENEIVLQDDYDGIKELDNRVPPWFSYLFYITIVFAVIYLVNFHLLDGKLQDEEYAEEIKEAEILRAELMKSGALINEETVAFVNEPEAIESGKSIYTTYCTSCHAPDGGGLIGPNLTDEYWIHGGDIKNVFKVISDGVVTKGMISWKGQLNPKQIQEVASYVLMLKGTTPANGKKPEGEKFAASDSSKDISMK